MEPSIKRTQADKIVKKYTYGSIVPSVIPLPLVDAALITAVQLKLLHSLCRVYDVEFSRELGRSLIASLVGGGGSLGLAAGSAYLLKSVPVIGQIGGMIGMAVFGTASTFAVGSVFIQHFETGGTLLTFDAEKVRDFYAQQFREGRQVVQESFAGVKP